MQTDDKAIQWQLYGVTPNGQGTVIIIDKLSPGHRFDAFVLWSSDGQSASYSLSDFESIFGGKITTNNASPETVKITFNARAVAGYAWSIYYATQVTDDTLSSYENTATINYSNNNDQPYTQQVTKVVSNRIDDGIFGDLIKDGVVLHKVNQAGQPLAGAQFELTGDGLTKTATSNAQGKVEFTNLKNNQTYLIKEIVAPQGYQKSNQTIVVKIIDDKAQVTINNQPLVNNNVVNQKLTSSSMASSSSEKSSAATSSISSVIASASSKTTSSSIIASIADSSSIAVSSSNQISSSAKLSSKKQPSLTSSTVNSSSKKTLFSIIPSTSSVKNTSSSSTIATSSSKITSSSNSASNKPSSNVMSSEKSSIITTSSSNDENKKDTSSLNITTSSSHNNNSLISASSNKNSSSLHNSVIVASQSAHHDQNKQKPSSKTNNKKLPQTGDATNNCLVLIGMSLLLILITATVLK